MKKGATPKYSVILAAYNEAGCVGDVLASLKKNMPDGTEFIVVDDGSTDATSAVAGRFNVTLIRNETRQGKGGALLRGIVHATGDVAVFLDADGQDRPEEVPLLLNRLAEGYDLVIGSKFIGTCNAGAISPLNAAGNRFMTAAINMLYGSSLTDSQSGFKAIRLATLRALNLGCREYDIEAELVTKALKAGLKVTEVPVTRDRRASGSSGFKRIRHGTRILFRIIRGRIAS